MQMAKQCAIDHANEKFLQSKEKQFVIWEPDTYNNIFNRNGYKVVDKNHIEMLEKQGFSRDVIISYEIQ